VDPATLEALEALAWAAYLDAYRRDKGSPRVFDEWRKLWAARKVEVPAGAWETP
jgi:hypothetical protein